MVLPGMYQQHNIILYRDGTTQAAQASIVVERTLKVYLDENLAAALTCSPGNWTELGIGYLFNQGLIQDPGHIKSPGATRMMAQYGLRPLHGKPCRQTINPHQIRRLC